MSCGVPALARRVILLFAAALPACDAGPDASAPGAAPAVPPRHPALQAPPGRLAPAPGSAHPHSLPDGHPPISAAGSPRGAVPRGGQGGSFLEGMASLGLEAVVPPGWVEEPSREGRLATFRLPRIPGDPEDGELSVSMAGGSVEANVERWRGQFAERPEAAQFVKDVSGFPVTFVELEGTYSGMGGPSHAGTRLVGAIVKLPGDQSLFFKGWGPSATMAKWKQSVTDLVESFRSR
ncbi:MAG TPA: hypothetical protein VMT52_10015 [Planctomycetota bacterium]|nr:hypothetical protein [Planctomycetota bacterium]